MRLLQGGPHQEASPPSFCPQLVDHSCSFVFIGGSISPFIGGFISRSGSLSPHPWPANRRKTRPRKACSMPGMHWMFLAIAIFAEVVATSALKAAAGFTRPLPSVVVVVGYLTAFYFLSLTLRTVPVGVAYAIWSGVGIALISLVAWVLYRQTLDPAAWLGMGLIVSGVLVLCLRTQTLPPPP